MTGFDWPIESNQSIDQSVVPNRNNANDNDSGE